MTVKCWKNAYQCQQSKTSYLITGGSFQPNQKTAVNKKKIIYVSCYAVNTVFPRISVSHLC